MAKTKSDRLANKIISRLEHFAEVLESKQPVSKHLTCRKVKLDLKPTQYTPELVRKTREQLGVSQNIFAHFLGVSKKTLQAWEQGTTMPNKLACRFMDEIRHDPEHWFERLKDSLVSK